MEQQKTFTKTQITKNVYLAPFLESEDNSHIYDYINCMLGNAEGISIGIVLSLGKSVDNHDFQQKMKNLGFETLYAMESFHNSKKKHYDPKFSSLNRFALDDDNYAYEIHNQFTSDKVRIRRTLKFYSVTPSSDHSKIVKNRDTILKRIWYLSQLQPVCIQIKDITNPNDKQQAITIALAFEFVNTWVQSGWPVSAEQFAQQLNLKLASNEALKQFVASNENAIEMIKNAVKQAYEIYKQTPFYNRAYPESLKSNQLIRLFENFDSSNSSNSKTYIDNYLGKKQENSQSATAKLGKKMKEKMIKQKAEDLDFQLANATAKHKVELMQPAANIASKFNKNEMKFSDFADFAIKAEAGLYHSVMYYQRKGKAKKQGAAVAALKATYNAAYTVISNFKTTSTDITQLLLYFERIKISSEEITVKPQSITAKTEETTFNSIKTSYLNEAQDLLQQAKTEIDEVRQELEEIKKDILANNSEEDIPSKQRRHTIDIPTFAKSLSTLTQQITSEQVSPEVENTSSEKLEDTQDKQRRNSY